MREGECGCCDAFAREGYFFHGEDRTEFFRIVKTKTDKGHSERFMVVSFTHAEHVENEELARSWLFRFMLAKGKDFTVMESTHASIPDHWHIVACTLDEGEDLNKIADTDRIEVRFRKRMACDNCFCSLKE